MWLYVPSDLNAEVAADGAGERVVGAGLAQELAARLDGVGALPDHADDRARGHVRDESREELLASQVGVVLLKQLLGGLWKKESRKAVGVRTSEGEDGRRKEKRAREVKRGKAE